MKRMTYILAAYLIATLAFGINQANATTISGISQNASTIGRYTKYELTFTLSRTYTNPFDPCEVDVMVTFHQPDGTEVNIPGFYYQAYTVSGSNPETYTTAGAISWKARFAPSQLGSYTCDIKVTDVDGTATVTTAGSFTCQESGKQGFIRIDPNQHNFLKYYNGDTRINIGQNIAWNTGGIYGWNNYLVKMHNADENWVRLWSCIYGSDYGVALEWKNGYGGKTYFQGAGKPSLQTSLRMDSYVQIAEQNNIAIQFTLQHHGQFSTSVDPDWNNNPYDVNGGGWLTDPCQYFRDPCAIQLTKNKFRYIVARWGYSTSIFAWEIFNEVQFTNAGLAGDQNVITWHNTMASYISSIDAFQHPITTSSYDPSYNLGGLWTLPDINIIQVHYYGTNTIHSLEQTIFDLEDLNKPVIIGENGTGYEGTTQPEPEATQLKNGLEMHNGIWSSFHLESSAHLWSWDTYIDPCNLYGVYTPLSIYDTNEDLADCNLATAQRAVSGMTSIYANPEIWNFNAITTQKDFYLQGDCFPGMDNLNQYLQGTYHPAQKSDPNFHLNMPTAGSLKIHVTQVSGSGTNSLAVLVNGTTVFSSGYADGSTNFIITVPLSAGQQTVQVKNTGQDWFNISSYEFAPNTPALLDSMGLISKRRGYFWIYDVNSQYGLINNGTFHNQPVIAQGLEDGLYNVYVYATWGSGGITNSGTANSLAGQLTYTLPDFNQDTAVKVIGIADIYDLADFSDYWLQTGSNLSADLNHDGKVDFADFCILAGYWMNSIPASWPF